MKGALDCKVDVESKMVQEAVAEAKASQYGLIDENEELERKSDRARGSEEALQEAVERAYKLAYTKV